jgi:hypothetical protein
LATYSKGLANRVAAKGCARSDMVAVCQTVDRVSCTWLF